MKKLICDICKEQEASKHFKVKEQKEVYKNGSVTYNWVNINVCLNCYNKLIDIAKTKNTSDLCEYYNVLRYSYGAAEKPVCYGTKNMQECSCNGHISNCTHYPEKRGIKK